MEMIEAEFVGMDESGRRARLTASRNRSARITAIVIAALLPVLFLVAGLAPAKAAGSKEVLRATLPNGLRVVIVRNTLAPVVTTVMNYKVGSDQAPEGFPGMAHAQEHMMFRGSPGLSAGQLADIAAAMGGEFDADTQQTVTQYFFTVPVADLDVALHVESIRMQGVLDTDKLWDQERGAIEQEVAQDLSNPEYVFYTRLLAAMFRGTPYAHDALGSRPSFNKTTGDMLHKFYGNWYAPNNAILVIVGNVDPHATLDEVKKLFGRDPGEKASCQAGLLVPAGQRPDTESENGPALRTVIDLLPHARIQQPGFCRGRGSGRRPQQPARQPLRAGARGQGPLRGLFPGFFAGSQPGLRHRGL